MFQQVECSVRPTHMKNKMNSPVAAQSFAARNDITYSPKIASTSETTDTFELRNPDNTVEGTESPQAITLCWALSFLALFDFLGGFHLMAKKL